MVDLAGPEVYARGVGYARDGRWNRRQRRLAHGAGHPQRFDDTLQRVRVEHGRKRNLMTLIDRKGW